MVKSFKLPRDFLLGTATASCQIEGGDDKHNWYRWCEEGHIKDGTNCYVAADHWNRYKEDIQLMKMLNNDIYRMSLEWSRIEPKENHFSEEGLCHYRNEIKEMLAHGIQPLVTLHHFSHPLWLENMGGWENPSSIKCFLRYTKKVVEALGDLVSDWVTINEPNVYLEEVFIRGTFPSYKTSMLSYFKAAKNMIIAHIKSYQLIHKIRRKHRFNGKTLVGVANHIALLDIKTKNPITKLSRSFMDRSFHQLFLDGMIMGKFISPIGYGNYPFGNKVFCDFIGVNYYSRHLIVSNLNPSTLFCMVTANEDVEVNDLGWEIYPQGLYVVCKKVYQKYKLPIFITENGVCDEKDKKRSRFIYEHLYQIANLIHDGVDIKRYYHWSLIDNFEWIEGLSKRFGLIHVDYDTQKRTIRSSGNFYSEICKEKAVTKEMIEKFLR